MRTFRWVWLVIWFTGFCSLAYQVGFGKADEIDLVLGGICIFCFAIGLAFEEINEIREKYYGKP